MTKRRKIVNHEYGREWLMEQVGNIPADFVEFCKEKMMHGKKLIFATLMSPKTYKIECQHCGKTSVMKGIKRGELVKCPICGKKGYIKNTHNICNGTFRDHVVLLENIRDEKMDIGIMVRYFCIEYDYNMTNFQDFRMYELQRVFISPKIRTRFFQARCLWGKQNSFGAYDRKWINGAYFVFHQTLPERMLVYTKNIKKIISLYDCFRYIPIVELCRLHYQDPVMIIDACRMYKQIEYLVKVRLYRLAEEMIYLRHYIRGLNTYENNLRRFLQLKKKEYYDFALRHNVGSQEIQALQWLENKGITPSVYYVKVFTSHTNLIDEILGNVGIKTLLSYIKRQKLKTQEQTDRFLSDYRDYISACVFLGYDMRDTLYLKPKDFKKMHDRVLTLKAELQQERRNIQCREACLAAEKMFSFEAGKYILHAPKDADDIISEGKRMCHCVGTFIDRVIEKRSVILFIRKKDMPDEPFVTMEVNPANFEIVQVRARHNEKAPQDVMEFLKKWKKKIIEPILLKAAG